jgi:uncharacterized protein YndB with AHSA1/START domain
MEATVIKRTVTTSAPRERVWKALTNPKNLSKWMISTHFDTLAVGEAIAFAEGDRTFYGSIAAVEPPEHFAYRWPIHDDHPIQTLVSFHLEALPNGTQITVTEEGFDALPEPARQERLKDNIQGWGSVFEAMIAQLEAEA